MKILMVHPACRLAIWDVARGYRSALGRLLGDASIQDYYLDRRLSYHIRALEANEAANACPKGASKDQYLVSKLASETIIHEALCAEADLVFIVSGLNLHPICLKLLERVGIPAAILLTENPYDDDPQREFVSNYPSMAVFTHERFSAEKEGWLYLPHAYDPAIHRPVEADPAHACDVMITATGWRERQAFLESVDWSGINLRVVGPKDAWPAMTEASPIWKSYHDEAVDNAKIAPRYAAAKICLNFHRQHPDAWSPNPRAYEIAGCGAFQLSDPRQGVTALFGESVPVFDSPESLGNMVRQYLNDEPLRTRLAAESHRRVQQETFDERAKVLIEILADRFKLPWLQEA